MTSSGSCSGRLALALALAGAAGCRGPGAIPAPGGAGGRPALAVLPLQNLTGGRAPVEELEADLRAQLAAAGVAVAAPAEVDRALARRRIRSISGLDEEGAGALREGLGVEAVLVSSVDAWVDTEQVPRVALSARLVSATDPPRILWMDRAALAWNDSPGAFGTGLVREAPELRRRAVARLVRSLVRREQAAPCDGGRMDPQRAFRSPVLDDPGRRSVAVLPFLNDSSRGEAGEVLALEFVRQLRAGFEVVEPGLVRHRLLASRIILQGGVSLDTAQALLGRLRADLVLTGTVRELAESARGGTPAVEFSIYVLDRHTDELVWSSTSRGEGEDGVYFFGIGRAHSAGALACRMASGVTSAIIGGRGAGGGGNATNNR